MVNTTNIPTCAIGGKELVINAELLRMADTNAAWVGYDIRVGAASGSNWTRVGSEGSVTVLFDNPESDTTFTIPLYANTSGTTWEPCGAITGILYHSLGAINISISLIRNAVGSALTNIYGLSQIPPVNRYSYYKPDGSAPYGLGEFRYYTPNAVGGLQLDKEIFIINSEDSQRPAYIDYKSSANIWGKASKYWFETLNKPYASSRLRIYKGATLIAESDTTNMDNEDVMLFYTTIVNESATEVIETDWTVQSWHLYSGTWYLDKTLSFNVYKSGVPWALTFASKSLVTDVSFTVNWTYTAGGSLFARLAIGNNYSTTMGVEDGTATINFDENFHPETGLWKVQVQFNSVWYDVLTGNIQ